MLIFTFFLMVKIHIIWMYVLLQVSEILMPGILTALVFSVQKGEMLVFYQNSQLLVLLCFTSGICRSMYHFIFMFCILIFAPNLTLILMMSCRVLDFSWSSGLRSGCFAIANMILVRLTSYGLFIYFISLMS